MPRGSATGGWRTLVVGLVALWLAAAPAAAHQGYVANAVDGDVSVIDTLTNTSDPADDIAVGDIPGAIAIGTDGTTAYVTTAADDDVSLIDTATNTSDPADDIAVGDSPVAIAITPDGTTAYVANENDDDVSAIDTATNTSDPADDIAVGDAPFAIAITPDGTTAYVANRLDGDVSVIDTLTNTSDPAEDIPVGDNPQAIAITPDGTTAYAANAGDNDVSVIDTATDTSDPSDDIPVGEFPSTIAISPDGSTAYVGNRADDDVSVIDTETRSSDPADDIAVGDGPDAIAITPDGSTAYVGNVSDDDVSIIDTATNASDPADDIPVGEEPFAIAITPNEPPSAALSAPTTAEVGQPVSFDASASTDDDGVESYTFDFGDGEQATTAEMTRNHAYSEPGTYEATVTADDGEGCPSEPLFPGLAGPFTGQTAYCNGPSTDFSEAVEIEVTAPPVFEFDLGLERPQGSLTEIIATVTCTGADCDVSARGHLRVPKRGGGARTFPLADTNLDLTDGVPDELELAISPGARDAARKALKAGRRVTAIVRADAESGSVVHQDHRRARVRP